MSHTLTLNVGSSSVKFVLFRRADQTQVVQGVFDNIGQETPTLRIVDADGSRQVPVNGDLTDVLGILPEIDGIVQAHPMEISAIAHRVVHGGWLYDSHRVIDEALLQGLETLRDLAPNHLPLEIGFIRRSLDHYRTVPQVACFDTVFHRDLPDIAKRLPLPRGLFDKGVRRYGFHGLSYTYLMGRLPDLIGDKAQGRVVLAHLGSGASMAAVRRGKPVDTTMAATPLGGLMMATRSGDLDPGIPGFLARAHGVQPQDFEHMVSAESGLKGVSGATGDIRDLLAREKANPAAAEAIAMFCYQTRKWVAAMAAALEGIDVLVFSGGIGANAPVIRQRICEDLDWMGLTIDTQANATKGELCISAPGSKVMIFALPTDEESVMAATVNALVTFNGDD